MEFNIPFNLLPEDINERYVLLHDYFCDQRGNSRREDQLWIVKPYWPNSLDYFVDPEIRTGFDWWNRNMKIDEVYKEFRNEQNFQLSLNDSWTLYSWSKWIENRTTIPKEIVILHIDYHNDLMSPRIGIAESGYKDLLTGSPVDIRDSSSVKSAILSGAIGMGSFMMPVLHSIDKVYLRHLCKGPLVSKTADKNCLIRGWEYDTLIARDQMRPKIFLERKDKAQFHKNDIDYMITSDRSQWIANMPDAPILLHIDMDYFNCRYDGDSDWHRHIPRYDPDFKTIEKEIELVFSTLVDSQLQDRIVDISIALSPGFFPSEFWEKSIYKIQQLIKKVKH